MNDALIGVAKGLCGHIAANELLSGTIGAGGPGCKTELALSAGIGEGK